MSSDPLRDLVGKLGTSAEALAALGAVLRLRMSGTEASAEVEACLAEVVNALGVEEALAGASPAQLGVVLSPVRALFLQALDLLNDPAREPGWSYTDAELLESQGQTSAAFAALFRETVVPALDGLGGRLERPDATFLDVGVGVAGLTVAMCQLWPTLRAVGIDSWDPALVLARRNVSAAGLADRIELRHQLVEDLDEIDAYDLVFLPGPFLAASSSRVRRRSRPAQRFVPAAGWSSPSTEGPRILRRRSRGFAPSAQVDRSLSSDRGRGTARRGRSCVRLDARRGHRDSRRARRRPSARLSSPGRARRRLRLHPCPPELA